MPDADADAEASVEEEEEASAEDEVADEEDAPPALAEVLVPVEPLALLVDPAVVVVVVVPPEPVVPPLSSHPTRRPIAHATARTA